MLWLAGESLVPERNPSMTSTEYDAPGNMLLDSVRIRQKPEG